MSTTPQTTTPQQTTAVRPVVMVGPSAVGKGTLTKMLFDKYPGVFGKKISTTTRAPRVGEENGRDYYFVSLEKFKEDEKAGLFIETADIHGKMYGTSFAAITAAGSNNRIPLLELDVQGVCSVKRLGMPKVLEVLGDEKVEQADLSGLEKPVMDTTMIWINPPTPEALLERLKVRGTETEAQIEKRMNTAKFELNFFKKYLTLFDKVIINDDLQRSFGELEAYLFRNYPTQFESHGIEIPAMKTGVCPVNHGKPQSSSQSSAAI